MNLCPHCMRSRFPDLAICPHCRGGYEVGSYGPGERFGQDMVDRSFRIARIAFLAALLILAIWVFV